MGQQRSTPACTDAGYIFQYRLNRGFLTTSTVTGNRKTVRFIPDLLDQV